MSSKPALGAIVLVVIGGAWFAVSPRDNAETGGSGAGTSEMSGMSSLSRLLLKPESQRCTVSAKAATADSAGTVYFADGMMRGEFENVIKMGASGKTTKNYMVIDKEFAYMWGDEMEGIGMKMSLETMEENNKSAKASGQPSPFDMNQESGYVCEPWPKDMSVFTPPTTVVFTDMSAMLKSTPTPMVPGGATMPTGMMGQDIEQYPMSDDETKAIQCAACEQAGPSRNECRAAFSCDSTDQQ